MRAMQAVPVGLDGWPQGADMPCAQSAQFARALEAHGGETLALALRDGGRTVGHALTIRRGARRLISRGPVWAADASDDERRAGLAVLRGHGGPGLTVINAERDDPVLPHAGFLRVLTPAWVAEWGLSTDVAALRAGLHQKWRNRLKAGEAAGWQVRCNAMDPDPDHWLFRHDARLGRERGYRSWPPTLIAAWVRANPGSTQIWTAARKGEVAAAALVLRHGARATWQIGWAAPGARAGHAMPLVLWQAAVHLAGQGMLCLDLGTLDTVNAPGVARFKLGTGARARALGGTWAGIRVW
jgi:hypothetical protein